MSPSELLTFLRSSPLLLSDSAIRPYISDLTEVPGEIYRNHSVFHAFAGIPGHQTTIHEFVTQIGDQLYTRYELWS